MKLFFCLLILVSKAAAAEDLSGKMITFPEKSDDAHVKVEVSQRSFSAVTLCHRSFTDLRRSHSFLSLTTPDYTSYGFQTCYNVYKGVKQMSIWVKSVRADYELMDYTPNTWHSICSTWNSSTGVVQLWMNGQPLTKKYLVEFPITGNPQIILGQEQSKYDSLIGFISTLSFVGMLTDVHMWDYVLSACDIRSYMADHIFPPGNVINWSSLDYQTRGRLMVDDKQTCQPSTL